MSRYDELYPLLLKELPLLRRLLARLRKPLIEDPENPGRIYHPDGSYITFVDE